MQRLFPMFPIGLPGIGLLCLRLTAALSLCLATQSTRARFPAVAWLLEILCFSLIIGMATPLLALCCVMVGVFTLITTAGAAWQCTGISILVALALAFLGPGGYSADARMFGRRSVVLNNPDAPPERKDRA
ncbi:hypothetical protein IHE49_09870 [Rhodanobacter sp. 7MK24]|uniref:hypothetical protein n=1 Tax=Rhodanobacter sp. 7MK24 TaxID=2775922 RepID=UPI00177E7F15|nr:hypothetical protein [Rhodanobacter sp. 7MK24]MBD8880794.1 hypothetical protein [Rhodanobacter sp. 7MK24]